MIHSRSRGGRRALALLCCLIPLSASLRAADAADAVRADPAVEEEIIVLGSRTPLAPTAVAGAVTQFTNDDLAAAQLPFATELLRTLPSAAVSRSGGFGGLTQVRLRGSEGDHTLVLIDGFELNDPANGSEFDFAHLRGTTIGGIEILPGPVGALWGSDALAGAIALSTPRARRDGTDAGLRLVAGEHDTLEATGRLGYRDAHRELNLVLDRYDTDGTNVARAGGERDGYRSDTLSLGGRLDVSERLALHATVRHVDAELEFDPAPFPAFVPADGDRETELRRTLVGLRGEYEAGRGWTHALGLETLTSEYDDFADGTRTGGREGGRDRAFLRSTLDFSAGLPGAQRFTLLGELEREQFEQDGTATVFGDPNQDQALDHRSLLAEWRWETPGGIHVTAAARRDWNDAFDDANHYRIALRAPMPAALGDVWTSYATATKNPGFTERFGFTPDTFLGNPELRPERSRAFEAGWTRLFRDGTVQTELVWHRTRLEDEIDGFVFDAGTGLFTAANRNRDSRRDGVEARVLLKPQSATTLTLRYAFLDASEPDATGRVREIRRPRHAAGLNLQHGFSALPLTLRTDLAWVGSREDRDFGTFPATPVELDDFVTVDVALTWRGPAGLDLFLRGEDLFSGNREEVFGFASPGQTLRAGFEYRMR
ncbi:MAG: TonB-dependent receptor [Pseudomonadales bacterium]|jgi:vitamin B12 transporter|nr:TonB-dependent receptor [Pseudomonadales bacterium]